MNIYKLEPKDNLPKDDNPWEPWYDKCFGIIVCAKSPKSAREMANRFSMDETGNYSGNKQAWLSPKYSKCRIVKITEREKFIMQDNRWA